MTIGDISTSYQPRQRTLAQLRWVAIIGQLTTLGFAYLLFGYQANYALIIAIIAMWGLVNLAQNALFTSRRQLQSDLVIVVLAIDILELTLVLYLTGGLNNPFSIQLLVPVVLGAIMLERNELMFLNLLTFFGIVGLYISAAPLVFDDGQLATPLLLRQAIVVALIVTMVFLSFYLRRTSVEARNMATALTATELALQRELRISSLGALVAAYAHELGTPLATVRLAANDVLNSQLSETVREDMLVIRDEIQRSSQILADMGRIGKSDLMIDHLPFSALIHEAAEPHMGRGKEIVINVEEGADITIKRSAAIVYGLRNIFQNAVDFAATRVDIDVRISDARLLVSVTDDGPGFSSDVLSRVGEPMNAKQISSDRAEYQGMGLGIFIAKNLLEANHAMLTFANRPRKDGNGAVVRIVWPLDELAVDERQARAPLGQNPPQHA